MSKTHIIRGLCLAALLVPTTAFAFAEPEDILTSQQNQVYWNPPPSARDTGAAQAAQASSDAARRASAQAMQFGTSATSTKDSNSSLHGAAGSAGNSDQIQALINALQNLQGGSAASAGDQTSLDPATQRLILRIKANQTRASLDAQAQMLASQQSLHGGAPLAGTGPGTTLSLLVIAIAGVWTVWKARRMKLRMERD